MRKSSIIGLVMALSFFTPFLTLTPVTGISFTYTRYWFYIDTPQVVDYSVMQFTVKNNHAAPREIVCTFQTIEGLMLDVIFDWDRKVLGAGESVTNHYKINISSTLATTFNLDIYLHEKPQGTSDNQLLAGGIITNRVIFYSDDKGTLLQLRITDQADRPRVAHIILKFSVNDSMPFTPIKEFVGAAFLGVLPHGRYLVQAYDTTSSVYAEEFFTLDSPNQTILVRMALVGFGRFKLEQNPSIGINTTIFNHVGEIEIVRVYAELYRLDETDLTLLETSLAWEISPLPLTTNQYLMLWFRYSAWRANDRYIIRGVIETNDLLIAHRLSNSFQAIGLSTPTAPTELVFIGGGIILGTILVIFVIIQLQKRNLRGKLNEKINH